MIEGLYDREVYQIAKKLLDVTTMRQEAIASNIANVETPGYKRVELSEDFLKKLKNEITKREIDNVKKLNPSIVRDNDSKAVRPDGNNVQLDRELLELNRNALEHEYLAQYMSTSLNRLKTAITGKA